MTMTVHALAGLNIGIRAGWKRRPIAVVLALGIAGHVILDRLPHDHFLPVALDLACSSGLILAALARRFGPRGAALRGLASSVLPDAFRLLPARLDFLHIFPGAGSWRSGVWPVLTQTVLGAGLLWLILKRCEQTDSNILTDRAGSTRSVEEHNS